MAGELTPGGRTPFIGTPEEERKIREAHAAIIDELEASGPMTPEHLFERLSARRKDFNDPISNNGRSVSVIAMAFYRAIRAKQVRILFGGKAKLIRHLPKQPSVPDHVPDDLL